MTVTPIRAIAPVHQSEMNEQAAWNVLVALQRFAFDNPEMLVSPYYRQQIIEAQERWAVIFRA